MKDGQTGGYFSFPARSRIAPQSKLRAAASASSLLNPS
jgi:hypothetical protein